MSVVHERECEMAGLNPKDVAKIARRIERAAKDAGRLGLTVFGGAHSADLRIKLADDDVLTGPLIVVSMEGSWDGGDGGCRQDENGLMRGEGA